MSTDDVEDMGAGASDPKFGKGFNRDAKRRGVHTPLGWYDFPEGKGLDFTEWLYEVHKAGGYVTSGLSGLFTTSEASIKQAERWDARIAAHKAGRPRDPADLGNMSGAVGAMIYGEPINAGLEQLRASTAHGALGGIVRSGYEPEGAHRLFTRAEVLAALKTLHAARAGLAEAITAFERME